MKENCKKYLNEFIGTFFLVLTVACASLLNGEPLLAPVAIASILAIMVYAGGSISGGHYNPAVSLACAIRGVLPWKQFVPYCISQIVAGLLSYALFRFMAQDMMGVTSPSAYNTVSLFIAEFLFTFALCWVVLQTATVKSSAGNSYYGLAIGFVVLVGAFSVGGTICAAAFNPAVAITAGVMNLLDANLVVITVLANLCAGGVAAGLFKFMNTEN